MKKALSIVIVFIVLGLITFPNGTAKLEKSDLQLDYVSHSPFNIDEDIDFVGHAFPGIGSSGDPYIIENYSITSASSYGIRIRYVTKYFIIRNCLIENQNDGILIDQVSSGRTEILDNICSNNIDDGIKIEESGEVTVENNICQNNGESGIYITTGIDSRIENNTCSQNTNYGIYVDYTDSVSITQNDCNYNEYEGINVKYCSSAVITENICEFNNDYGIALDECPLAIFQNNKLDTNNHGAQISDCNNIDVSNNEFSNSIYRGCNIWRSENINVADNMCANNKEGGLEVSDIGISTIYNNTCYNNGRYGLKISEGYYSTISFNNLTGNGLELDEDLIGFYLTYSFLNNTINNQPYGFLTHLRDEVVLEDYGQILLVNCSRTTIEGKDLVDIKLVSSPENKIINNSIEKSDFGINLWNSGFCEILNNTIRFQYQDGISAEYSSNTVIANNTIENCNWGGIKLSRAPFSEIVNNTIQNCMGCWIYESSESKFIQNTLSVDYGVSIQSSTNLIIENNYFYKGGFDFASGVLDYLTHSWVNNLVKGKPAAILNNLNSITITEQYAQLLLINCDGVTIENQKFENVPEGVVLELSNHITIQNCTFTNGGSSAILIRNSSYVDIQRNTIDTFYRAVDIYKTQVTTISQNSIMNNRAEGIYIYQGSNNNFITNNILQNNSRHGILIGSESNIIHHNNFKENVHRDTWGSAQAKDTGNYNLWYDEFTNEGNFWDDWSGFGAYILDGSNEDPFPLSYEAPIHIHEFSDMAWFYCLSLLFLVVITPILLKTKNHKTI